MIAAIEDELQEQGTSIIEVLYSQRDFYLTELNNVSTNEQGSILAMIKILDESIAAFEGTAFILPEDSNFDKDPFAVSTNSFYMSPNCTCNWLNILLDSPCGHCIVWSDISMAVAAISAGFSVRGWSLASDLILFNRSNKTLDIDYWPSRGNQVASAPQIANDVAYSSNLTEPFSQQLPGRLNGIFVSTVEGDTYNSLGKFWYSKTGSSNGNVSISIIDRYDWERGENSSGGVFNNTMAMAQEIGMVTPFYTRINITIPGTVPFNWEYTNSGVAITGAPTGTTVIDNIPTQIHDLRIRPRDNTPQAMVNITSIGANAFANQTSLTQIQIPATVTSIGNYAFLGATGLKTITNYSTAPQPINSTTFSGVNRSNITLYVPVGKAQAYINAGWTGFGTITEIGTNTTTITIAYAGGGHTSGSVPTSHTVTTPGSAQLKQPGTLAKAGHTFAGWKSSASGNVFGAGATVNFTGSGTITYTAQWKFVPTHTIAYNGNGNTSGSMTSHTFADGTQGYYKDNAFNKTGHTFDGWHVQFPDGSWWRENNKTKNGYSQLATWQNQLFLWS